MSNEHVYLGIDLGTTFSSAAIYNPDTKTTEVIEIDGKKELPSMVAFNVSPHVVGEPAKGQLLIEPTAVAYDSKRMIGQSYDDVMKQKFEWPFRVESSSENDPEIVVACNGKEESVSPVQVSAEILKYIKSKVEVKVGHPIDSAVITVPEGFSTNQRKTTKEAAELAGFNINKLALLAEPTAAAIKYAYSADPNQRHHILIYDFGGGTFDISLATIDNKTVEVKSTGGDSRLGGQDIDAALVNYLAPLIQKNCGIDIKKKGNEKMFNIVKRESEQAKLQFSDNIVAYEFNINCGDKSFIHKLMKNKFINLIDPIVEKTITLTKEQLDKTSDQKKIILVGGSSMIPLVRTKIEELGISVIQNIPPLTAVAEGAAYFNYIKHSSGRKARKTPRQTLKPLVNYPEIPDTTPPLYPPDKPDSETRNVSMPVLDLGKPDDDDDNLTVVDVLSKSIGIVLSDGTVAKLLTKNTPLPCSKSSNFMNAAEADAIGIDIVEGEAKMADDCIKIGRIEFEIPPGSAPNSIKFTFKMAIDEESLINCKYTRTDAGGGSEEFKIKRTGGISDRTKRKAQENMQRNEQSGQVANQLSNLINEAYDLIAKVRKAAPRGSPERRAADRFEGNVEDIEQDECDVTAKLNDLQELLNDFKNKCKQYI
ncbi:dnaK protein [Trichomonas vaginalis G3]|uniref:DnaK protein n=1 Tax=Trichomonas vaginalis (strain ATCC PRA-98 / G3) TaxID=412133 RepID=A2DWC1_TRIV3|nr:ATP binding [Trichomonas vaginalis G3]EAY15261.1 dnaK protein [Trichomonas vaginalis G3]KAI5526425.1 ATP binding [Trichomonas vaginalis G3]|eukprot:XP_001327484.1 dnaK protein [Trichomonas vaginalis G3]